MAGDCTHTNDRYANTETLCLSRPWSEGAGEMESTGISRARVPNARRTPNFEVIDGLLYRKKLERGLVKYREVLDEDSRHEAISTFHRRPDQCHLSLEETYKCVAENYWWEGMYFQIRDIVLGCPECRSLSTKKAEELGGRDCVTKTMASHSADMLCKLRSQREAGLFCDITLRTSGRPFQAHRAVLAAVSDHFQEIFAEMDVTMKADIDLTGFSEENLLSLLEFSYSSTLCVRRENLPEVMAMARHLGMWPAVDACNALLKEQEQQHHLGKGFTSACAGACNACHRQQRESKRKGFSGTEGNMDNSFSLKLDVSDDSLEGSPRRILRKTTKPQSHNGLPMSPSHRMKLMDFKSPSSKKASATIATSQSQKFSPILPSNARLLRSTPGAAKEVQRLLPPMETPRRKKACHSVPRIPCSPVKVKQEVEEVGEDELDYARAQEKYKLMNVLGLQRTALLPRPEDLIGWRQKKRLRKLKANNYSLTKRRKPRSTSPGLPFGAVTLSLPLCNPVNTCLLKKPGKTIPVGAASMEQIVTKRPKTVQRRVPPSDRSMRSKGTIPDMFMPSFGGRELRRSVRTGDRVPLPVHPPARRNTNKTHVRNTFRIKSEPIDYSISGLHFASNIHPGHTPDTSSPTQRALARSKATAETVRAVRYNSGRPASKAKVRRASTREMDKAKERKVGSQGMKGMVDTRQGVNEAGGMQFAQQAPPASIYNHPLYKAIKKEPVDPVPVGTPFCDPPSPDRGKRQSKPPIKLLDSGFLFSFCRPAGGTMAVMKKEEESVDICLTRSVSQVRETFGAVQAPHRALRARGPPTMSVVKREREERSISQSMAKRPRPKSQNSTRHLTKSAGPKATRSKPKQGKVPLSNRSCVMLDAVRRARLKQLRGPRSQAPKVPKASHACLECQASYKDCDALIMHRLRHVEGKHWPCPLCCKTFFRLRNVRSHISTHDPKLYKCRSCIVASS